MPQQPSWLPRVNAIIEILKSGSPLPFLTRASIEELFGLKRRQAIELMKSMDRFQVGKEFVVRRETLLRWLRCAEIGEKVWYEEVRRQRVEESIEAIQWEREARKTRIVVAAKTVELKLAGIPPTVSLKPGEMRIKFFGAEDLFRQLFEVAQVMRNDYEKFKTLVDK